MFDSITSLPTFVILRRLPNEYQNVRLDYFDAIVVSGNGKLTLMFFLFFNQLHICL